MDYRQAWAITVQTSFSFTRSKKCAGFYFDITKKILGNQHVEIKILKPIN